jgi:hypothetical protein
MKTTMGKDYKVFIGKNRKARRFSSHVGFRLFKNQIVYVLESKR